MMPLKIGELAYHLGHEIGLAKQPCARRLVRNRHPGPSNTATVPVSAMRCAFSAMEPRRAWKDDTFKLRHAVSFSGGSPILLPKEAGVGEAGAQHPFVAGDDGAIVFGLDICDHDKAGRRPIGLSLELRRNSAGACAWPSAAPREAVHEALVDGAHPHYRPFNETSVFSVTANRSEG